MYKKMGPSRLPDLVGPIVLVNLDATLRKVGKNVQQRLLSGRLPPCGVGAGLLCQQVDLCDTTMVRHHEDKPDGDELDTVHQRKGKVRNERITASMNNDTDKRDAEKAMVFEVAHEEFSISKLNMSGGNPGAFSQVLALRERKMADHPLLDGPPTLVLVDTEQAHPPVEVCLRVLGPHRGEPANVGPSRARCGPSRSRGEWSTPV